MEGKDTQSWQERKEAHDEHLNGNEDNTEMAFFHTIVMPQTRPPVTSSHGTPPLRYALSENGTGKSVRACSIAIKKRAGGSCTAGIRVPCEDQRLRGNPLDG